MNDTAREAAEKITSKYQITIPTWITGKHIDKGIEGCHAVLTMEIAQIISDARKLDAERLAEEILKSIFNGPYFIATDKEDRERITAIIRRHLEEGG